MYNALLPYPLSYREYFLPKQKHKSFVGASSEFVWFLPFSNSQIQMAPKPPDPRLIVLVPFLFCEIQLCGFCGVEKPAASKSNHDRVQSSVTPTNSKLWRIKQPLSFNKAPAKYHCATSTETTRSKRHQGSLEALNEKVSQS